MRFITLLLGFHLALVSGFAQSSHDLRDANIIATNSVPNAKPTPDPSPFTLSRVFIIRENIHLRDVNSPYIPLRDSLYSKIFSKSIKSYRLEDGEFSPLSFDEATDAFEIPNMVYATDDEPRFPWPPSAISVLSIVKKITFEGNKETYDEETMAIGLIVGGEHSMDEMDTYIVSVKYEDIKGDVIAEWVHPLNNQMKMPAMEAVDKNFLRVNSVSATDFNRDYLDLANVDDATLQSYKSHILFPYLMKYASYAIPTVGAHEVNTSFTIFRQISSGDAGNEMLTDIGLNKALSAYLKAETSLEIQNDSTVLSYFSIKETLTIKNGEPGAFSPLELSWRNPGWRPCTLSLDNPVLDEGNLTKLKRWIMDRKYTVSASYVTDAYGQPVAIPENENQNKHFIPLPVN